MKNKQQVETEFTFDTDGHKLAHVALANSSQRATLYAEDWHRLSDAGFTPFWQHTADGHGNQYPVLSAYTERGANRIVTIARLIAQAGAGKRVRYADGNTLNLRLENLKLESAPVRRDASAWFPSTSALRAAGIVPAKRERRARFHDSNASDGRGSVMPDARNEVPPKISQQISVTPSIASQPPDSPRGPGVTHTTHLGHGNGRGQAANNDGAIA